MHKEEAAMKKIGMLTSGGDCQALNAAMRGVVKACLLYTSLLSILQHNKKTDCLSVKKTYNYL